MNTIYARCANFGYTSLIISPVQTSQFMTFFLILLLCIFQGSSSNEATRAPIKVCQGSEDGLLSVQSTEAIRVRKLRERYEDCTHIEGNLEITYIFSSTSDLSFLNTIEEVTGYVLIYLVYTNVPLLNLQLIRGQELLAINPVKKHYRASLVVYNTSTADRSRGMEYLKLYNLREVSRGDIVIELNYKWCGAGTVNFFDLIQNNTQRVTVKTETQCPKCHAKCDTWEHGKKCWDHTAEACQKLSKTNCDRSCRGLRCFGSEAKHCCSFTCAAGCSGDSPRKCRACAQMLNGKQGCVSSCPKHFLYDQAKYSKVKNPDGKFAVASLCLDECPRFLYSVIEKSICVRECDANEKTDDKTRTCKPCGDNCGKKCSFDHEFVNSENIDSVKGCTTIKGNIVIVNQTFTGHGKVPEMKPERLAAFKSLKILSGCLFVTAHHPGFTSLDYFDNLETINYAPRGKVTPLTVHGTSIKTLGLRSLSYISNGGVLIQNNTDLCLADTVDWGGVMNCDTCWQAIEGNRPPERCDVEEQTCWSECMSGCWGTSSSDCVRCRNYRTTDGRCVADCSDGFLVEEISKTSVGVCGVCHPQCSGGCTTANPANCTACRNFKQGDVCVEACPRDMYGDEDGVCRPCNQHCLDGPCSGPSAIFTPESSNITGGCMSCNYAMQTDGNYKCISGACPGQHHSMKHRKYDLHICHACHPECDGCTGFGPESCILCKNHHLPLKDFAKECLRTCHIDQYSATETLPEFGSAPVSVCRQCDHQCKSGCFGPNATSCNDCLTFKRYINASQFECVSACEFGASESVCHESEQTSKSIPIDVVISVTSVMSVLLIVIIILITCLFLKAKRKERTMTLAARMSGLHDMELDTPLCGLTTLREIADAQLKPTTFMGIGMYGIVYKGVWIPEGENSKLQVAIKELQNTGELPAELIRAEAQKLCRVEHVCCVRISGVCFSPQLKLITPFMPLGDLRKYVKNNKKDISSKPMLDWCKQIAKGMAHLEGLGIVHSNLAARNVLVQSAYLVKVSDYGQGTFNREVLKQNNEREEIGPSRLPWTAVECLKQPVFTHKTDVWSFGITVWEVCSYGEQPYSNVTLSAVATLLEKGERLPQPSICSIDIYMIMIKCWMREATSRPCFSDLADEFAKAARDPGRFLCIKGDKYQRQPSNKPTNNDLSFLSDTSEITGTNDSGYMNLSVENDPLLAQYSNTAPHQQLSPSSRLAPNYAQPQVGPGDTDNSYSTTTPDYKASLSFDYSKWLDDSDSSFYKGRDTSTGSSEAQREQNSGISVENPQYF